MADISSCISEVKVGTRVRKGEGLGHFEMGGSSMVVLFSKECRLNFTSSLYDKNAAKLQKVNSLLASVD
jgi:hypothetical protein